MSERANVPHCWHNDHSDVRQVCCWCDETRVWDSVPVPVRGHGDHHPYRPVEYDWAYQGKDVRPNHCWVRPADTVPVPKKRWWRR